MVDYGLKDAEGVITMLSTFEADTISEEDKKRVTTLIVETAITYSDADEVEIYDLMTLLQITSSTQITSRLKARKQLGAKVVPDPRKRLRRS